MMIILHFCLAIRILIILPVFFTIYFYILQFNHLLNIGITVLNQFGAVDIYK